jgi:hypothetical protein
VACLCDCTQLSGWRSFSSVSLCQSLYLASPTHESCDTSPCEPHTSDACGPANQVVSTSIWQAGHLSFSSACCSHASQHPACLLWQQGRMISSWPAADSLRGSIAFKQMGQVVSRFLHVSYRSFMRHEFCSLAVSGPTCHVPSASAAAGQNEYAKAIQWHCAPIVYGWEAIIHTGHACFIGPISRSRQGTRSHMPITKDRLTRFFIRLGKQPRQQA